MANAHQCVFVNAETRSRIFSDTCAYGDPAQTLVFAKYDKVPLHVVIVAADRSRGPTFFKRWDVTNLGIEVAINDTLQDSQPLCYSGTFTKNTADNSFTGDLELHTDAMNTYLDTTPKSAYFEIRAIFGNGQRMALLTEPCTLVHGVQTFGTVAPDPASIYLTLDQMKGLFCQRIMGAGETITFVSPNGQEQRVVGVGDDAMPIG